jgi:hypothetical protein
MCEWVKELEETQTYNTIFVVIGCCFLPILPLSFLTFNVDFVVILSNFEGFIVRS